MQKSSACNAVILYLLYLYRVNTCIEEWKNRNWQNAAGRENNRARKLLYEQYAGRMLTICLRYVAIVIQRRTCFMMVS